MGRCRLSVCAAAAVAAFSFVSPTWATNILDTTATPLYHLNAASGITTDANGVNSWADANGNGVAFTESTALKEPSFSASSANFNNQPIVHFDGDMTNNANGVAPQADRLAYTGSTTVQTVVIIGRTTGFVNLAGIWGKNSGDNGIRMKDSTDWQVAGGSGNGGNNNDFPTSLNLNGANTFSMAQNAPFVMVAEGSALSLAATGLGEYFYAGTTVPPRPWAGDIAEMAVYNTVLSPSQISAIDSYATSTYAIPTPEPTALGLFGCAALGLIARRRAAAR